MLVFTFPGQGSQRPGMGAPWADHPSWDVVAEASEAAGRDLTHLLLHADQDELTQTRNSQLACFTLSLVVLDAVERTGLAPALAAGHSLGEYTALVAVGALGFDEGVRLVAERGEAMQEAAEERWGTMAAVLGLEPADVWTACRRADGDVWVANDNAPGQVVIAGDPEAVERAGAIAKELGAKRVMGFPVGGAFHTPFMAPAKTRLRKAIAEARFNDCEVPVVANVDATAHREAEDWPALLSAQLTSPVQWRRTLDELGAMGAKHLVEIGPGGVLTGMAKRGLPGVTAISVGTPDDVDKLLATMAPTAHLADHPLLNDGEHLFVRERLVVAPAAGLFTLDPAAPGAGSTVEVGGLLGTINGVEVRSPFLGAVQGYLAVEGERVAEGEPIAWLLASEHG
jgi:[acyl-carrier-protein] S-malonyltransferase